MELRILADCSDPQRIARSMELEAGRAQVKLLMSVPNAIEEAGTPE